MVTFHEVEFSGNETSTWTLSFNVGTLNSVFVSSGPTEKATGKSAMARGNVKPTYATAAATATTTITVIAVILIFRELKVTAAGSCSNRKSSFLKSFWVTKLL